MIVGSAYGERSWFFNHFKAVLTHSREKLVAPSARARGVLSAAADVNTAKIVTKIMAG